MQEYLVPLDGSVSSEAALPWAKALADKDGSQLSLVRCYNSLSSMYTFPDFATPEPISYDLSGILRQCEQYLVDKAQSFDLGNTRNVVKEGDPAEVILKLSESEDVKAVLMSSVGGGGFGRWLLGSVATKVIRASRKPVFVVRPTDDSQVEPVFKKILVALDGSKLAECSLEPAFDLASKFGSEVTLFRAIEYTPYPMIDLEAGLDDEKKHCEDYLQGIKGRYPDVAVKTVVKTTQAGNGILQQAKDSDLVVMSSHGYGGFERWLLGSVTEKVLQKSKGSLLVVYGKETESEL